MVALPEMRLLTAVCIVRYTLAAFLGKTVQSTAQKPLTFDGETNKLIVAVRPDQRGPSLIQLQR